MTPFSQYKGWLAEGGIRNALIVSGPAVKRPKGEHQPRAHACRRPHADAARNRRRQLPRDHERAPVPALMGKSWGKVLAGQAESPRTETDYLGWEVLRQPGRAARATGSSAGNTSRWARATGSSSTSRPIPRAQGSRRGEPGQAAGTRRAVGRLRQTNHVVLPSRSPYETLDDQLPKRVPVEAGFPPLIYKRQFVPPADMLADPKP